VNRRRSLPDGLKLDLPYQVGVNRLGRWQITDIFSLYEVKAM